MKNWQLLLAAASALMALSACDNSNPALTGPPREPVAAIVHKAVTETENGLEVSFDNRMDILFVIDNSESMTKHQTNLKNNINKFIEAFASIDSIDYHIAYTFVHDRTRFKDDNSVVPRVCGGKIQWDDVGTLQPFVGTDNRRYLTRDDRANIVTLLKDSWDPTGANASNLIKKHYNRKADDPADVCSTGPEVEESFSPMLAVLKSPPAINEGFRRPGAFFVTIMISDAKDGAVGLSQRNGGITEEQVFQELQAAVGTDDQGRNRFRVFAVAMKPGDPIVNTCVPDPAFKDADKDELITLKDEAKTQAYRFKWGRLLEETDSPLATLAKLTQTGAEDQVLSICDSDYGTKLAQYGAQLQEDALPDVTVPLSQRFQVKAGEKLTVSIGDPAQAKETWTSLTDEQWDMNSNNSITVYAKKVDWIKHAGQKIIVRPVPVDLKAKTTKAL